MNKQFLFMLIFSVITSAGLMAQPGGQRGGKERVEAQMVAYLTNTLELTPAEAEKFWPVYNEYKKKREDLRTSSKPAKNVNEMTDQEARQWLDATSEKERKLVDLKENYNKQFLKILPVKKVVKLHQAERGFKRELIQKIGRPAGQAEGRQEPGKQIRKMKMLHIDRTDN